MQAAIRLATVNGKPVYRFPVRVTHTKPLGTIADWLNPLTGITFVTAHSARDAAQWVYDRVATVENTEIEVYGPKGGVAAKRFIGYESAIWNAMGSDRADQLRLAL